MKMKNSFPNKMTALITVLVLAVGSISIVGTSQFVMGQDGGNINGSIIACVYGACKDNNFNGGTSGGGGGGGQPTPNTATLTVIKKTDCGAFSCNFGPETYKITVTGENPSPNSFQGDAAGTKVTLGPGKYTVSEENPFPGFEPKFEGGCISNGDGLSASGNINAGETQECTITNSQPIG